MNAFGKETPNNTPLLTQPPSRKNSGAASVMRKYQQLALAVVSVVSLMAFLFYKHEYDRLRYAFEYLEMFGTSPVDVGQSGICVGNINKNVYTTPHFWMQLSDDLTIYSSFWDERNGFVKPVIRTLSVIQKLEKPQIELQARILFESDTTSILTVCSLEEIKPHNPAGQVSTQTEVRLATIICEPESITKKIPYLIQFNIGIDNWSPPVFIEESQVWKSVPNVTCACVYSMQLPVTSTQRLIEFISHHSNLGIGKFIFFGPILTPPMRKVLDKYEEESNVFYEEKAFTLPKGFHLKDEEMRVLVEQDCIYRHRGVYENVITLKINEFLIPRNQNSLQEILSMVGSQGAPTISEYHFVSQKVCLDQIHSKNSDFLLDSQIHLLDSNTEARVAVLRPHLITRVLNYRVAGAASELHVPSANANVYSFEVCDNDNVHKDIDHLPTYSRFVELIKRSVLYRKWKTSL